MSITANPFPNHDPATPSLTPQIAAQVVNPVVGVEQSEGFVDRRETGTEAGRSERRQFASSHSDLSPDARELATAIDRYKIDNRRRYITCEEMLAVVKLLGYRRDAH